MTSETSHGTLPRTVHVVLIEWRNGTDDPYLFVTAGRGGAVRAAVSTLTKAWADKRRGFNQAANRYMVANGAIDAQTATVGELEDWIEDLHDATTAPWVTIKEMKVRE